MTEQITQLAIGQVWRRRDGGTAEIIGAYPGFENEAFSVHLSDKDGFPNGWYYNLDGTCGGNHPDYELVELLCLVSTPQPMSPKIPDPIRTGAAPFYVLVASDDSAKGGGNPIVWETVIPEGCTLQAALQQQRRVGSRYGTTYIAECRIISELTQEVKQ